MVGMRDAYRPFVVTSTRGRALLPDRCRGAARPGGSEHEPLHDDELSDGGCRRREAHDPRLGPGGRTGRENVEEPEELEPELACR